MDTLDPMPPGSGLPGVPAAGDDVRPRTWPSSIDAPSSVVTAWRTVVTARDALLRQRQAFEAEIRIAPSADLLVRDDPPRAPELDLDLHPAASVAWTPLRSEMLLAEARVVEAESAWIEAWREAAMAVRTLAVELARARAERDEARRAVVGAESSRAPGDASKPDRSTSEEAFDLREARLDLADAEREVRQLEEELAKWGIADPPRAAAPDGPLRADPQVPPPPDPVTTRAYRAVALRAAADVARSERRWRDAVVPLLAFEVGYAGSDGRIEGGLEMRHGRPSARLDAALVGTPQERGWASISAAFRIGSDQGRVRADLAAARLEEVERLAAFEDDWRARWSEAVDRFERLRDRWRLAEDRLVAMTARSDAADAAAGGDGHDDGHDDRARQLDRARRAWLRMAAAYEDVLACAEAWPRWNEDGNEEGAGDDAGADRPDAGPVGM